MSIVKAGRDFELIESVDLGEQVSSSPIAVDNTLYIRSAEALYAIGEAPMP